MKKFGLRGEQEGEFSTIKEITKLVSNGHPDLMIQNSLLRIEADNLMPEKIILHLQTERNRGKSVMKDTFEKVSTLQKVLETLENWYIGV